MITIITSVLSVFFKALKLVSRIAVNRVAVILTFCASVATVVAYIFSSLNDQGSVITTALSKVSGLSLSLGDWVAGNDYLQLIAYGLSLDTLLSGLWCTFVWVFCTLSGILITVCIYVFYAVLPLFADLIVSGLQKQHERIQNALN